MVSIDKRAQSVGVDPATLGVAERIDSYRPEKISAAEWAVVGPPVRSTLHAYGYDYKTSVNHAAWVMTGFHVWAHQNGLALGIETLTPDNVERYVATSCPPASQKTIRSVLRRIGLAVTRKAPWDPVPPAYAPQSLSQPYNRSEVATLWAAVDAQTTKLRAEFLEIVLLLGLGAGLSRSSMRLVRPEHITRASDGAVEVRAGYPDRTVPCLDVYADRLEAFAAHRSGVLVGTARRFETVASRTVTLRNVEIRVARLRATWIAHLVTSQVPVVEALRYSGLKSGRTLVIDENPYAVDEATAASARAALRAIR